MEELIQDFVDLAVRNECYNDLDNILSGLWVSDYPVAVLEVLIDQTEVCADELPSREEFVKEAQEIIDAAVDN